MCGIAGILNFDDAPVTKDAIKKILEKIAHRGRDFSGICIGSRYSSMDSDVKISQTAEIGLGHNRLSILDLNHSGSQPMVYSENNLCITYNGEIYNYLELKQILEKKSYSFKTRSDTEVLLAAYDCWGKSCVDHLNGMFAFAIWDEQNKKLFCARDPIGIKPFYYKLTPKYFAFASESQALIHLGDLSLHYPSLLSYFLSMYVATNESIFTGIKKLLPGHMLSITPDGQHTLEKFWSVDQLGGVKVNSTNLENLTELIHSSVTKQLKCDVPVGGFLSGGIDSGIITAMAAPQVKKYFTYSVGYEGLANNELPQAKKIAERYGTQHTEVTITALNAMTTLNKALDHMCEPIADPAMVATYLLSELAAADGVKVLLNGTGGDEIFAGYTRYTGELSLKRRLVLSLPRAIKKLSRYLPINDKLKSRLKYPELDMLYSTGGSYHLAQRITGNNSYFSSFVHGFGEKVHKPYSLPLLYQYMLFDMQVYLPDQLLLLLDQMTMAHTIEGRVPLLDVDIIKFAFNFNANEHVKGAQTKSILKKITEPCLGADHVYRKKQGFAGSSQWWVSQKFNEFVDVIADIRNIPYFEDFDIDEIINENQTNDIFLLYCFCKWYNRIQALSKG